MLDAFDTIKICTSYRYNDTIIDSIPFDPVILAACEPIYQEVPGWKEKTLGLTEYDALPVNAKKYIELISSLCGVSIDFISTGPGREHTISVTVFVLAKPHRFLALSSEIMICSLIFTSVSVSFISFIVELKSLNLVSSLHILAMFWSVKDANFS